MIIASPGLNITDATRLHVAGVELNLRPAVIPGNRMAMCSRVPDDHPVAPTLRAYIANVRFLALFDVELPALAHDATVVGWTQATTGPTAAQLAALPAAAPLPATPAPGVANLRDRIKAMGWDDEDLVGLSLNASNPGVEGGCSNTTGLPAITLAMCSPPRSWYEERKHLYPWEVSGWTPPVPSWRPPLVPAKPPRPSDAQGTAPVPEAPVVVVEDDVQHRPFDPHADAPIEDTDEVLVPVDHLAVGVYGTREQVSAAITLLQRLAVPGKRPSKAKIKSALSVNDLPPADASVLDLLLADVHGA